MEIQKHCICSVDGSLENSATPSQVIQDYLATQPNQKPLAIWVHGGLVSTADGLNAAKGLGPWLLGGESPAVSDPLLAHPVYPVFMIWETGIGHNFFEAIASIAKRYFTRHGIVRILTGLLGVKLEGFPSDMRGATESELRIDELDRELIQLALEDDDQLLAELAALNQESPRSSFGLSAFVEGELTDADIKLEDLLRQRLREEAPSDVAGQPLGAWPDLMVLKTAVEVIAKVGMSVLNRHRNNTNHSLKETIIEELVRSVAVGGEIWKQIKDDAAGNFGTQQSAGSKLIAALKENEAALANTEILLVGHSAGSIYLLEFLKAAAQAQLNLRFHVRFLAAAATFVDTDATLSHGAVASSIASFRSYAMSDPLESKESLLHGAAFLKNIDVIKDFYVGSLLYMVSGAFEAHPDEPLVGMERMLLDRFDNRPEADLVQRVVSILSTSDSRAFVWSKAFDDDPRYQAQADTHGGFGNDTHPAGALRGAVIV